MSARVVSQAPASAWRSLLELFQPTILHHARAGERLLSTDRCSLDTPWFLADVLHQGAVLRLTQSKRDLLVAIPFALDGIPLLQVSMMPELPTQRGHICGQGPRGLRERRFRVN